MTTKTIELPAPRELKMTLTEALKARKTIRSFTTEPISDADLSTLLWCTAGITRPDGKRTVPSCLDLRTVSVCVLRADGAWRWNASKNTLELLTPEDLRAASTMGQHAFVDTAPVTLVFVVEAPPARRWLGRTGLISMPEPWSKPRIWRAPHSVSAALRAVPWQVPSSANA